MADPRGTLYVSCRFDINISKHFSIKLNLLNTAYIKPIQSKWLPIQVNQGNNGLPGKGLMTVSPSDVCKNCSVVDKSMKIGTNVLWQVLINFR